MEQTIFDMAINQGLTAVLFVVLLWHTLKTTGEREEKLQRIIDNNQSVMQEMVAQLSVLTEIKTDVDEIKTTILTATKL